MRTWAPVVAAVEVAAAVAVEEGEAAVWAVAVEDRGEERARGLVPASGAEERQNSQATCSLAQRSDFRRSLPEPPPEK